MNNKVELIGYTGTAPEIRQLESGGSYARFSLSTTDKYQNSKGETVRETYWHNIVAFGEVAEIVKTLQRNTATAVSGKLVSRNYIDKAGQKRYITEVHISELLIIEKP